MILVNDLYSTWRSELPVDQGEFSTYDSGGSVLEVQHKTGGTAKDNTPGTICPRASEPSAMALFTEL